MNAGVGHSFFGIPVLKIVAAVDPLHGDPGRGLEALAALRRPIQRRGEGLFVGISLGRRVLAGHDRLIV
jgi:hypothetical protein